MALGIELKILEEERYKVLVLKYPYVLQIPNIILLLISLKKSENKNTSHYNYFTFFAWKLLKLARSESNKP